MKADYINPHQNTWHENDFKGVMIGEEIVVDGHKYTVLTSGIGQYGDVELTGEWADQPNRDPRVWPNMQWVALNWEDDDV